MKRASRRVAGLLVLLLVTTLGGPARADVGAPPSTWFRLADLDGNAVSSWFVAGDALYAGGRQGGVRRSTNGGADWSAYGSGLPSGARVDAVFAQGPLHEYAGTTAGLFRFQSGAWQRTGPTAPVRSVIRAGDATLAGTAGSGLWRTVDGTTWTPVLPEARTVAGLWSQGPVVLAAADTGAYRSTDGGVGWTRISDGLPASTVTRLIAWSQRPARLTAVVAGTVWTSADTGAHWAPADDGLGGTVRDLVDFSSSDGQLLYAATSGGLSSARRTQADDPLAWGAVTEDGLGGDDDLQAITRPVVPSGGAPGLLAGTSVPRSYFLGFVPPSNNCSADDPAQPTCPKLVDNSPTVGQTLTATSGTWTGTDHLAFAYQWESCTTLSPQSCDPVEGATRQSFVVPTAGRRYRVRVTASNAAPTFATVSRTSWLSALATANPQPLPGDDDVVPPDTTPTDPAVGDVLRVGDTEFDPAPTSTTYRWLRCDGAGNDCAPIPDSAGRQYTAVQADAGHTLRAVVTGSNAAGSREVRSLESRVIRHAPAAVVQSPRVLGDPVVGATLAGSVGVWQDPTTSWTRQWQRCDGAGAACAAVPGATGPTYTVAAGDVGSTLRLRVTATVPNTTAVTLNSPVTAVVPPVVGPPPPPPAPAADRTAPVLGGFTARKKRFVAGKGKGFALTTSEGGTATLVVTRKKKRWTSTVAVPAGAATVRLKGKRLEPGRYVATLVVVDAAGNASAPVRATFRVITKR